MTTTVPAPLSVVLDPDTPAARRVVLALPCDRCNHVRPVYPCRPGELLCRACHEAALADLTWRNTR